MTDKWLDQYRRLFRDFQRQQELLRNTLGPTGALQQVREGVEMLRRIEQERTITDRALRAVLPSGLTTQVLGRNELAAVEEIRRAASEIASYQSAIQASGLDVWHTIGATLQTAGLAAAMQDFAAQRAARSVSSIGELGAGLTFAVRDVYADLAARPAALAALSEPLREAPAIAVYTTTRSLAVVEGGSVELLEEHEDPDAEDTLNAVGVELEGRLRRIHPAFAEPYRGALRALEVQGPDWCRHTATSLRELTDKLIAWLAPDEDVERFFPDPSEHKSQGVFTRKARLEYIYREVAVGSYTLMAEKHIDVTQAVFFPANAGVHTIEAPFAPEQMRVFTRQVEGCISMMLAAAGY